MKIVPFSKSNLRPIQLRKKPIKNKPAILIIFLNLTGLFALTAKGIAVPMIKRKAGNIKSAGLNPCH